MQVSIETVERFFLQDVQYEISCVYIDHLLDLACGVHLCIGQYAPESSFWPTLSSRVSGSYYLSYAVFPNMFDMVIVTDGVTI